MNDPFWFAGGNEYFLDENNLVQIRPEPELSFTEKLRRDFYWKEQDFIKELESMGYHPIQIKLSGILDQYIGHSYDEFLDEIRSRVIRNAKRKASRPTWAEEQQKWKELRDRFNGLIIGFDKHYLNTHPSGFSIRVLLKSMSKEDRTAFVEKNKGNILRWCTENMPSKYIQKIGSMDYYTPSEIAVLSANEIEVFYEVKGNPQDNQ